MDGLDSLPIDGIHKLYRLLVVSIPATGTNFLNNLLKPDAFRHVHSNLCREKMDKAHVIVAPLRHPAKVWSSWCRKQDDPPELFWECFRLMSEYAGNYRIHFLPVDVPDRDERLKAFGELIGRKLVTEWRPENVTVKNGPIEAVDLSPLWEYGFVARHYPDGALSL